MTHEQLRQRCRRIMALHPESTASLTDCLKYLPGYGAGQVIAATRLAGEMAEYIEALCGDHGS